MFMPLASFPVIANKNPFLNLIEIHGSFYTVFKMLDGIDSETFLFCLFLLVYLFFEIYGIKDSYIEN